MEKDSQNNDISRELRLILSQMPNMRKVIGDHYRGLKGSANK